MDVKYSTEKSIAQQIQTHALALGYEKCGIIPVSMMAGYEEKLNERVQKVAVAGRFYQGQRRLVAFREEYPWAKSVVVLTTPYSKYKVPEAVAGHVAKAYLFDTRIAERTDEYQRSRALEIYMQNFGLQVEINRKFGLVGLRWAAMQAGLGIIRRNNFFYTESGSWLHIEAFLTDWDMELISESVLPPCPPNCDRCIKACPTASLCEAYTMNPLRCVSFLTTFGGRDLPHDLLAAEFGDWIYGCDICQETCPMNCGKWSGKEEFPGLAAIAPNLTAENILKMDERFYRQNIQPKFFYLSPDEFWKWQVNSLNFLDNRYQERFGLIIQGACKSKYNQVRDMAASICKKRRVYVK